MKGRRPDAYKQLLHAKLQLQWYTFLLMLKNSSISYKLVVVCHKIPNVDRDLLEFLREPYANDGTPAIHVVQHIDSVWQGHEDVLGWICEDVNRV
jgi:hypothetical protein